MDRILLTIALAALLLPTSARAISLTWQGGASDVTVGSATVCSLTVVASPDERMLPREWRLIWAGTADVDSPLVLLPGDITDASTPTLLFPPMSPSDSISHLSAAFFSADQSPARATYAIRLRPSLRARLTIVTDPADSQWARTPIPEVTVNGGTSLDYPPVLWGAGDRSQPGASTLALRGWGVDRVQRAYLLRSATSEPESLAIVAQSSTELSVAIPADASGDPGTIFVQANDLSSATPTISNLAATDPAPSQQFYSRIVGAGGMDPHMAVDPISGVIGVAYTADDRTSTYFATLAPGGAWQTEPLPSGITPESLAYDRLGRAHIIASTSGGCQLEYGYRDNSGWHMEPMCLSHYPYMIQLQVEPTTGIPSIAYRARYADPGTTAYWHLLYSRRQTYGSWSENFIELGVGDVSTLSHERGPDGITRVAYVYQQQGPYDPALKLAVLDASGYFQRELIGYGYVGDVAVAMNLSYGGPMIAIDGNNAYGQPVVQVLYKSEGVWTYDIIEGGGTNSYGQIAAVVSPSGLPHVVYTEYAGYVPGRLKHAWRAIPEFLKPWSVDIVAENGFFGAGGLQDVAEVVLRDEEPFLAFDYGYGQLPPYDLDVYVAKPAAGVGVPSAVAQGVALRGPFPNPSRRGAGCRFEVESGLAQAMEISLFDVCGKRVRHESWHIAAGEVRAPAWRIGRLPVGVYWVRVRGEKTGEIVRKWVLLD